MTSTWYGLNPQRRRTISERLNVVDAGILRTSIFTSERISGTIRFCSANGGRKFDGTQPHYSSLYELQYHGRVLPVCPAATLG